MPFNCFNNFFLRRFNIGHHSLFNYCIEFSDKSKGAGDAAGEVFDMGKILFFDVDGTLYNYDKVIPESAKESLLTARRNGHELAIATGRAPFMIEGILKELEIDTYVAFNGQYVVYKGEVIFTDGVSKETLKRVIDFGISRNEPVVFLDALQMIASASGHISVEESLATLKYSYPAIDGRYYIDNSVYQTLIFTDEQGEQSYRQVFPDLQIIRWHPYSCDLLPKGGSKARGIQKILAVADIELDKVVAFGDGLNDVEMLSYVPASVAMGNGHPAAKEVASMITEHVDQDGLMKAMKKLKLI